VNPHYNLLGVVSAPRPMKAPAPIQTTPERKMLESVFSDDGFFIPAAGVFSLFLRFSP
jgi:hypothetical protein